MTLILGNENIEFLRLRVIVIRGEAEGDKHAIWRVRFS